MLFGAKEIHSSTNVHLYSWEIHDHLVSLFNSHLNNCFVQVSDFKFISISYLFSGEEDSSTVMGVVTNEGLFEGKISTRDGDQYIIAQSRHFFTDPQQFHSVIYRHSDVHMPKLEDTKCKSDEIHWRIRTFQKEEGKKKSRHSKLHYHTRLKSKEKGSSIQHPHDNNKHILKENVSTQSTMDNVAFQADESTELKHRESPNKETSFHIPNNVHRNTNRSLSELSNDSAIDSQIHGSVLSMGEDVNISHSVDNDNQKYKHPANYHKSAQNHHNHHHHHNHHKHHHQDNVATAYESNDDFQRLINEYKSQDIAAIDTNPDLEEIDIGTNGIEDDEPSHLNLSSPSLPKDYNDVLSASQKDSRLSENVEIDDQHNANDHVQMDYDANQPQHRQKRAMIDPARITCSLYLQADHLFFQKFHSNEETVIEQLTQHVQGVNEIYGAIGKFMF